MAKIALISDVHLGTKQYGIKERYQDFLDSFRNFGDSVYGVDAVVIGGDLFDSPRPDAHSVLCAQKVVGNLKRFGCRVLGIDGNHDLASGDWLRAVGVEPFDDCSLAQVGHAVISGLHYRNGRDLVAEIQRMADAGMKADILVAHFALAEMNGGGSADTGVQELSPFLEKMGVKCVMMGHVHIPDHRKWNGVLYMNPGSTEMKASNEPKEKYYFVVDTETWEVEEKLLETRKVEEVEIASETDFQMFMERLTNEAKEAANQVPPGKRPFYQVIADDTVDDAFKRLAKVVQETSSIARIVMRSNKARDLAPAVDRREAGLATIQSAIEARFPKDSPEYRLALELSAAPMSADQICRRVLEGDD